MRIRLALLAPLFASAYWAVTDSVFAASALAPAWGIEKTVAYEWMASPEAQKQADEHEPLGSSVYVRGGTVEEELRGKKLSVVSWDDVRKMDDWQAKVFEAYGFPKVERKR